MSSGDLAINTQSQQKYDNISEKKPFERIKKNGDGQKCVNVIVGIVMLILMIGMITAASLAITGTISGATLGWVVLGPMIGTVGLAIIAVVIINIAWCCLPKKSLLS